MKMILAVGLLCVAGCGAATSSSSSPEKNAALNAMREHMMQSNPSLETENFPAETVVSELIDDTGGRKRWRVQGKLRWPGSPDNLEDSTWEATVEQAEGSDDYRVVEKKLDGKSLFSD